MSTVTGEQVWQKLLKDSGFTSSVPSTQYPLYEPVVKALPEVLADLLDEPVTVKSLLQAKAACIRFYIDSGFVRSCLAEVPLRRVKPRVSFSFGKKQKVVFELPELDVLIDSALLARAEGAISVMLEQLDAIIAEVPAFLRSRGMSEEGFVCSPAVGLSLQNIARYRRGALTIGSLLESQPSIIIKNS